MTVIDPYDDPAYLRHMADMEAEEKARVEAGGRTICPGCGERSVVSGVAKTIGVPGRGHPGDEYSATYSCENCDYRDMA
jgi:C4-type Zn-finger protein